MVGDLPWDRDGAAMLMAGSWTQRALRHSRLLRWSLNVAEELCAHLPQQLAPRPSGDAHALTTPPVSGVVAERTATR